MDKLNEMTLMELARGCSPMLQSSSSSDDEFDVEPERTNSTRISGYVDTINGYSNNEFKEHFRLSREVALKLIDLYRPNVKPVKGGWTHISAEKAIYITIWYLANMESFRQISDRFDVTRSCAHYLISAVVEFLVKQSPKFIKWPTQMEAAREAEEFKKKQGLQNIIGAIDGCHIRIRRPTDNADDYLNRKGYHSTILQGIVNSHKVFMDIVVGNPGSVHDARVLRRSIVYRTATENCNSIFYDNYCLLGDSAYPAFGWLKTPHKDNGHLTDEQRSYNYKHSATRMVIEHSFGLLKGRFRRLRGFENLKPKFIINCIVAACVLHNICLMNNDILEDVFVEEVEISE